MDEKHTPQFWDGLFAKGKEFTGVNQPLLDRIFERLGELQPKPPQTALDLGCGTGDIALLLARRGLQVTGLDLSEVALEKARASAAQAPDIGRRTAFEWRDFNAVDEEGEARHYDVAFMKLAFVFIRDRARFLRYVLSSLKPDGVFVLMTPVLLSGYEHDGFTRMTSVPLEQTLELLEREAPGYEIFDRSYVAETAVDMTFLLRAGASSVTGQRG